MQKRTASEILKLILTVAEDLETVLAVVLQGSRANPNVESDEWQDFDIVYLVKELEPVTADHRWIDRFGERLILQMPERMQLPPPANDGTFSYLMLFKDGNRIDLTLIPLSVWNKRPVDSLSVVLMDKDNLLPPLPKPSEQCYFLKPPDEKKFLDCCNEFWWTSTYIAKGLQRREVIYVKTIQETIVRKMLDQMIRWYIGTVHGWDVNPGKSGKYYKRYLSGADWRALLATYTDASPERTWPALIRMTTLFESLARRVSGHFHFTYPAEEAKNVSTYLREQFKKRKR